MFFKKKFDNESYNELLDLYKDFNKLCNEFSADCLISSRILGNYDKTNLVKILFLMIESNMMTILSLIITINGFNDKEHVKFIGEQCKKRGDKCNNYIPPLSSIDEIIVSDILKDKAYAMINIYSKFIDKSYLFLDKARF